MKAVAIARRATQLRPSEARVLLDDAFQLAWNAVARTGELGWSRELRQLLQRNRAIQGIGRGQRAWIVGNRASLADVDLGLLRHEHTFVVEPLAERASAALAPRYAVMTTLGQAGSAWGADAVRALAAHAEGLWYFSDPEGHRLLAHEAGLAPHRRFAVVANQRFVFGDERAIDLTRGIPGEGDDAKTAIAIALWMGFARINLVGIDGDDVLHASDGDQLELERSLVRSSLEMRSWRALADHVRKRGATLVSMSGRSLLTGLPAEPFAV